MPDKNNKSIYQHMGESNARLKSIEEDVGIIKTKVDKISSRMSYVYGAAAGVSVVVTLVVQFIFS